MAGLNRLLAGVTAVRKNLRGSIAHITVGVYSGARSRSLARGKSSISHLSAISPMNQSSAVRASSDDVSTPESKPALRLNPQILPFRVRIVRNEDQLRQAVGIRAEAYDRRWSGLSDKLRAPERQDRDPNSLIFLAERKSDNEAVGTMRIDTNLVVDLPILAEARVPDHIRNKPLAYVTRLGVKQGSTGSLVKLLMFKAVYRYCFAKQLAWIVIGVHPPADKDYVRMGFVDVHAPGQLMPVGPPANISLRMMVFDVLTAERRWREEGNPLYRFMGTDYHPDIEVFSSVSGMWSQPRRAALNLNGDTPVFDEAGVLLV